MCGRNSNPFPLKKGRQGSCDWFSSICHPNNLILVSQTHISPCHPYLVLHYKLLFYHPLNTFTIWPAASLYILQSLAFYVFVSRSYYSLYPHSFSIFFLYLSPPPSVLRLLSSFLSFLAHSLFHFSFSSPFFSFLHLFFILILLSSLSFFPPWLCLLSYLGPFWLLLSH